jgi:RES domain-containing protein
MSKIIWRICEATFAESAFSGEGASIVGGRWNSKGKRMVYTAEHLSLAILEVFVHLNSLLILIHECGNKLILKLFIISPHKTIG